MKSPKWIMIALALALVVMLGVLIVRGDEVPAAEDATLMVVYGGRLQSDMLFYGQFGVKTQTWDATIGIGWNNSVWLGGHAYFFEGGGIAAFSGLEMHILYPPEGTIEFHPALPLGFAIQHEKVVFIVEALVLPALDGEPVNAILAISFLFGL